MADVTASSQLTCLNPAPGQMFTAELHDSALIGTFLNLKSGSAVTFHFYACSNVQCIT